MEVKTTGIHHICLKVKDPKTSAEFYSKVCDMKIFSEEGGAYGLSGAGLDSLWLSPPENGENAHPFNRRGDIGLDHWAFSVASREDLEAVESRLKELGVEMEDGGITDDGYGGTAIFLKDPDDIPVEFHLIAQE